MPHTHQKTPFHCSKCPRTFKTINALSIHYGLQHRTTIQTFSHTNKKRLRSSPFECKYCSKILTKTSAVGRHISRRKQCKDAFAQDDSEEGAGPEASHDLDSMGGYSLVAAMEIVEEETDLPRNTHSSEPLNPERGTPGPDGSNYRILDFDNDDSGQGVPVPPPLRYDPKGKVWIEDYPVHTAGAPIRKATREEIATYLVGEPSDIGALADPENFEVAEFLLESDLSVKERERFLNLKKFEGQLPWSSNHTLMKDVEKLPTRSKLTPSYYETVGSKGTRTEECWSRDGVEVLRELLAIVPLRDEYHFRPEKCYTTPTRENRVYSEAYRSQAMWDIQARIPDEFATVVQYIVAMDETPLTGFCANKKGHPVYWTIGNLPKDIRRTQKYRAAVLLGYLPVPDLDHEPNETQARHLKWKLYNDCMRDMLRSLTEAERTGVEVVCADGNVRRIYPVLSSSIADFPEQCRNACTIGSYCPICLVDKNAKGDLHREAPLREKDATLQAIKDHREKKSANFLNFGLHDQWPWWNRHTYLDIATMHTPDLLHQLHKGVFKDHLLDWLELILDTTTLDSRYKAMSEHYGIRRFKKGVTKLGRATGREAKEMMKTVLPVASDTNPDVVKATRALLKFMYLAHSSTLTEVELSEMDRQLDIFHGCKEIFRRWLKTKRGFHNIAKFHALQHYTHSIRMLGTPDGYNTELPERLHIDLTKAGFRASNKNDNTELEQMAKYIQRMEAIAMHRGYLDFLKRPVNFDDDDSDADSVEDDGGEDFSEGCVVQKVILDEPHAQTHECGAHGEGRSPSLAADEQPYYPSPEIVTSKQRTECVTVDYLIRTHRMTALTNNLAAFLQTLDPPRRLFSLPPDTAIDIWTSARLFHETLPFKPYEPLKIDKIRAYPGKVDRIQRVLRAAHFDTVLVLAYPDKIGLHRYRAARVRGIFELPRNIRHYYPHKLVYVDWFSSFDSTPLPNLESYEATLSLDNQQNSSSSVIPLSAIYLTCHMGPEFGTIDYETELTRDTDIFTICDAYFVNPFGSYFIFNLLEHWARTTTRL